MSPKKALKKLQKDELFALTLAMYQFYRSNLVPNYNSVKAQLDSMDRLYMNAQMEVFSRDRFFPDANSTLRLSYGKVEGFAPRDAITYDHYTTLGGVVSKYVPAITSSTFRKDFSNWRSQRNMAITPTNMENCRYAL